MISNSFSMNQINYIDDDIYVVQCPLKICQLPAAQLRIGAVVS